MRQLIVPLLLVFCLMTGCRALDDDSSYEIDTRSMFFFAENSSGQAELIRVTPDAVLTGQEQVYGIETGGLSDFFGHETELWLSNGNQEYIRRIDLREESNYESYTDLGIRPYFICPGRKYLLMADSLSDRIAFMDLKNEKMIRLEVEGQPGPIFYNNEKFYLILDNNRVVIYNELALTPTQDHFIGKEITQAGFDKNLNLRIITQDSSGYFLNMIEHNADFIGFLDQPITYQKARYTPYLSARYGTEYLQDIFLGDEELNVSSFPDSLDHFEVDFFRGRLYGTFRDSLRRYELSPLERGNAEYFPYRVKKSFTYIDRP